MGRGGCAIGTQETFTVDEIKEHNKKDDKWVIINDSVYDVTNWSKKHPGGAKILSHFAGEDATDAWTAFHGNKDYVRKFMNSLLIGQVREKKETPLQADFRDLRRKVEEMGLFKVKPWFFIGHMAHIIGLEILAVLVLWYFGTSWTSLLAVSCILMTSQSQAGWTQHDYGHLSVFNNNRINHMIHHLVIGHLKGASSHWWNFRHFQHHAKPNILKKDPDIDIPYVFLLGKILPVAWGKKKRGFMPYNHQHNYFFLVGPPFLLPFYFHVEVIYFIVKRRDWWDMFWLASFFARFFYTYMHFLGFWQTMGLYMFARFLESHWFTWVTQMNHIPMDVDHDQRCDWTTAQLAATCNVDPGYFNNWFTGHLNYQIEHHLFPTMPRHNYHTVMPLVKSLCKKHGLDYRSKPLLTAFADIVRSLKCSGELWLEAYNG